MNTWINYMIEANLCLCQVLGLYLIFLRRETAFQIQRMVLLAGSVLSLVFPLIHSGAAHPGFAVSSFLPTVWLPEVVVTPLGSSGSLTSGSLWSSSLFLFYAGVCIILLVLFIIRLRKVLLLISKTSPTYERDGFKIIELPAPFTTFSFFRFIFLGSTENLSPRDKDRMFRHELAHGQNYHSIDILWINLLQIFFWMNPAIALYRKILIQLHEFQADARAAKNDEPNEYCSLLAKVALESADFKLANHFSNSLIIKRINMIRMHKKNIAPWRMALLITCATSFFYLIVNSDQVMAQEKPSSLPTPNPAMPPDDMVFMVVEKSAEYQPNGFDGLKSFIASNLKYPAEARKQGVEGSVFVSFIVEKDGAVTDATVVKGLSPEMDEEAVRVTKLTRWIPGQQSGKIVRSRFVLPIKYALDKKGKPGQGDR
jgi:TonB family protein